MCNAICAAMTALHYISDRRKQRAAASRTAGGSATSAAPMARLTTFKTLKTGIGFEGFEGSSCWSYGSPLGFAV
jgi:hypothetical protein